MSVPDELRNIRDHLRSGRFGQREVWERQLENAAMNAEERDEYALVKEMVDHIERLEAALREADAACVELADRIEHLELGKNMKPNHEPMLQFFAYAHLPERLQKISIPFCELAENIVNTLPRNPERTAALRKLLEAKDCAVRTFLYLTEKAE